MSDTIGRGYALGMSVLSISLLFVLCPLGGHWVDGKLGTGGIFAAMGFALGLFTGIHQLIRLTR